MWQLLDVVEKSRRCLKSSASLFLLQVDLSIDLHSSSSLFSSCDINCRAMSASISKVTSLWFRSCFVSVNRILIADRRLRRSLIRRQTMSIMKYRQCRSWSISWSRFLLFVIVSENSSAVMISSCWSRRQNEVAQCQQRMKNHESSFRSWQSQSSSVYIIVFSSRDFAITRWSSMILQQKVTTLKSLSVASWSIIRSFMSRSWVWYLRRSSFIISARSSSLRSFCDDQDDRLFVLHD